MQTSDDVGLVPTWYAAVRRQATHTCLTAQPKPWLFQNCYTGYSCWIDRPAPHWNYAAVGWARFNVPLDTVWVISETMYLQVRWPNQQCQSIEGGWLVIQIALNLTGLISPCYNNTTCMHIQDNDTQRNLSTVSGPSEMKQNPVD